jgi:hypothetical protein
MRKLVSLLVAAVFVLGSCLMAGHAIIARQYRTATHRSGIAARAPALRRLTGFRESESERRARADGNLSLRERARLHHVS